jgi:hypothetical protein
MLQNIDINKEMDELYHLAFYDLVSYKIVAPSNIMVQDFIEKVRNDTLAKIKQLTNEEKNEIIKRFEKRDIPIVNFIRHFYPGFEFELIRILVKQIAELS